MNRINRLKKTKVVAIKNFDEELYRLIKTYAALEGKTVASIFEEAVSTWLESRSNYREVLEWTKLDRAYEENLKVFMESRELLKNSREGFVLVCDGSLVGIFESYEEAIKRSREKCRIHSLIIRLPYQRDRREIEIGLPW